MPPVVAYHSSGTGNTRRFVERLGLSAIRIEKDATIDTPFVLITPTYADGEGKGAVPKPVIRFLNDPENRKHIRGVISGGNRNFGWTYGLAGEIIAKKCEVPHLYKFELAGNEEDAERVRDGLMKLWETMTNE